MKFGVLALDYDGTIARDGVLDPDVRASLHEARARGISVILVTGRILPDLKRTTGGLDFVDAVVAENGAVLAFPPNGRLRRLASPPSPKFLEELTRRGIEFLAGECVVEMDGEFGPQVLRVVRELELPLSLLFNRERLMVLPQGASKGTGLREALRTMRLSVHNALGMGDAENDFDLLRTCEMGVAVGWGSVLLQSAADEVAHGDGPAGVAAYVRRLIEKMRLPTEQIARHRIAVGTTADATMAHGAAADGTSGDGHVIDLAVAGRNLLITGDPRSGKSCAAGVLCEQLIFKGYSVCVIDTQGDYRGLEALSGVLVVGNGDELPGLSGLARVLKRPDTNVVIDLARVAHPEKSDFLKSFLPMLTALRRETGFPHHVVLDRVPDFVFEPAKEASLDLTLGGYTFVTDTISDQHSALHQAMNAFIIKRTAEHGQIEFLQRILGTKTNRFEPQVFASLGINQAIFVPGRDAQGEQALKFELLPRVSNGS